MHEHIVGNLAAAEFQQCRPEQRVKGDDVLADEMVLLQARLRHVAVVVLALFFQQIFQAGQVTDGGVEPDVEIFARRIGNFNAEVRGIPADVPVAQLGLAAFIVAKPLAHLVRHFRLQAPVLGPLLEESGAARVG